MAKKPRNPAPEPEAEQVQLLMPKSEKVVTLARRCKSFQKQCAEVSGTMGEVIAKAVESDHLDRKAFSIARGLDRMSDEKLAISYPHLMRYIEDLGIRERATAQGAMFQDDETGDAGDGKVTRLAGRRTREAAGEATTESQAG